jgi:hypothetical protein
MGTRVNRGVPGPSRSHSLTALRNGRVVLSGNVFEESVCGDYSLLLLGHSSVLRAAIPANAARSTLSRDCREERLSSNAEPKRRRRRCFRRLVIMVLLDKPLRVKPRQFS